MRQQYWSIRKSATHGTAGVVVAQHQAAAEIGRDILREGGHAVDAIIAASLALAVLEPWMSGLGGGGHMLVAGAGEPVQSVQFGMRAPRGLRTDDYPLGGGAASDLFAWPAVLDDRNLRGPLSVAVPGQAAGLGLAHARWGKLPWARLVEPALALAKAGHPVSWSTTLRVAGAAADLARDPTSRATWLPCGFPPVPAGDGSTASLPMAKLADTLDELARAGCDSFITGDVAAAIAADMQELGGTLDRSDLAEYRAEIVPAGRASWAGAEIHIAPGLTGGPSLLRALELFSPTGTTDTSFYVGSATALTRAYEERLATMGDADDSKAPACTTHLCAVDPSGNVVSLTQTLLSTFGARLTLPRTGLLMNNGIMWFDPRPGRPNSIGAGKWPLANMCPVIATKDGVPVLALGASGGRKIMPAVFQLLAMRLGCGMGLEEAFHTPRIDASGEAKVTVDDALPEATRAALAARFPVVEVENTVAPMLFACPTALATDGDDVWTGMAEPMAPLAGAAAV